MVLEDVENLVLQTLVLGIRAAVVLPVVPCALGQADGF